jgi:hypothetical protein
MTTWYLRSISDGDTHCGALHHGIVVARCGIRFSPSPLPFNRIALPPGHPPDPDQICPDCKVANLAPLYDVALRVLDTEPRQ